MASPLSNSSNKGRRNTSDWSMDSTEFFSKIPIAPLAHRPRPGPFDLSIFASVIVDKTFTAQAEESRAIYITNAWHF